jgi:N-formylglutamate deformylase
MQPSPDFSSPFRLSRPAVQTAPVVLTSPHSGRHYDAGFLASSRLDAVAIRRSEDSFVDELFGAGPELGLPLLAANFPRAYCDVNREAWELDPAMFSGPLPDYVNTTSPRVLAGLGTIARVVGNNEPIYANKIPFAEAQARIAACWQPYHATLQSLIEATLDKFGVCLVIDCHSMPSLPGQPVCKQHIVLGDGHGTSCEPAVTGFMQTTLNRLGLAVRRNEPYAGGYITRHYGCQRAGVQAVQVEVARGLYMNEANFLKNANFPALREKMGLFLAALAEMSGVLLTASGGILSAAAE